MRLPRVTRTVTFRLALTQAALFAFSAAVLFSVVYWSMTRFAIRQLRGQIAAEVAVLADARATDGLSELVRTIDARTRELGGEGHGYLLRAADGRRLAGSLAVSEPSPGWTLLRSASIAPGSREDEPRDVMALGQTLQSGEVLLVGRDTRDVDGLKEVIVTTFAWASGTTLILAIVGGLVTSLGFLRQIETVNAATWRIMAGNLAERVPVKGTGDEFDRLAGNLNEMLGRIQSLMEGLRQVSNDIAHDLRTPLAHMRQRLERARRVTDARSDYEATIEATIEEVDEILEIFAALLRIAQIEAGTRRGGFGTVDLSRVFATIVEAYAPVAEDAGQRLAAAVAPGVRVEGDAELLTQMLANLVENAIHYGGVGARVDVMLQSGPTGTCGAVSDTGPGIAPALREIVFRRFFRAEAHRGSEGNGLGLSLVRAVADLHDIAIRLSDNDPGLRIDLMFQPEPRREPRVKAPSTPGAMHHRGV